MGGRFQPEWVATFNRNQWQVSAGIRNILRIHAKIANYKSGTGLAIYTTVDVKLHYLSYGTL